MLHAVLFQDADQMAANYMFLTGLQADTIARYKSEISGVFERLERLERIATGQTPASPLYQDPERLERLYFSIQDKYCELCASFEKWLYNQGYFGTIAARLDTPKVAILLNA